MYEQAMLSTCSELTQTTPTLNFFNVVTTPPQDTCFFLALAGALYRALKGLGLREDMAKTDWGLWIRFHLSFRIGEAPSPQDYSGALWTRNF